MSMDTYDAGRYATRQRIDVQAITMVGTAAAAADLRRIVVADDMTVDKWYALLTTGATSAGIALTIERSLAGTGALTPVGTMTLLTHADNSVITGAVAGTTFVEGDVLVIRRPAGTVATTPIANFVLGWKERFTNAND